MEKIEAEKIIECFQCGSDKITAKIYINIDNKPMVSFQCAECIDKQLNIPTPIMGLEVTVDSVSFILDMSRLFLPPSDSKEEETHG